MPSLYYEHTTFKGNINMIFVSAVSREWFCIAKYNH